MSYFPQGKSIKSRGFNLTLYAAPFKIYSPYRQKPWGGSQHDDAQTKSQMELGTSLAGVILPVKSNHGHRHPRLIGIQNCARKSCSQVILWFWWRGWHTDCCWNFQTTSYHGGNKLFCFRKLKPDIVLRAQHHTCLRIYDLHQFIPKSSPRKLISYDSSDNKLCH